MICPNCNKENNNGVSFCVNCGTKLTPVPNTPSSNPYEYKDPSTQVNPTYNPNPQPQPITPNNYPPQNYMNNPQQQYVNNSDEATNKTAKKLAIISLCLFIGRYVLTVLGAIFSGILTYIAEYDSSRHSYSSYSIGGELITILLGGSSFLCFVASLVLIIIAKVKVSSKKLKNKFVNVVFWVEIGLIIANVVLYIILIILVMVACSAAISAC